MFFFLEGLLKGLQRWRVFHFLNILVKKRGVVASSMTLSERSRGFTPHEIPSSLEEGKHERDTARINGGRLFVAACPWP